jgi:hypothetical protein
MSRAPLRAAVHGVLGLPLRGLGVGLVCIVASVRADEAGECRAEFDLATLHAANGGDGSRGFVLVPTPGYGHGVSALAWAGDFNGDGVDDVLVGDSFALDGPDEYDYDGRGYVVFGRQDPFSPELALADLLEANGGDGTTGVAINGTGDGWYGGTTGNAVSRAGDLNGDGISDVAIANHGTDGPYSGDFPNSRTFLVFAPAAPLPPEIDLELFDPGDTRGVVVEGTSPGIPATGDALAAAGDVNGDGFDDVIIGAPGMHGSRYYGYDLRGAAYVLFGKDEYPDPTLYFPNGIQTGDGFTMQGTYTSHLYNYGDQAGTAVGGGGDVNGDGIDDLIVGAPHAGPCTDIIYCADPGETYIIFGRTSGFPRTFEVASLQPDNGGDGSEGVVIRGFDPGGNSGLSASLLGDVNGDGIDDLAVGAPEFAQAGTQDVGQAYIVFGRDDFSPLLDLARLLPDNGGDGSEGVVLQGMLAPNHTGAWVSAAGDFDGDGLDDIAVGAPDTDDHAGTGFVVFGRSEPWPATLDLESLMPQNGGDGSTGIVVTNSTSESRVDRPGAAGDLNRDGIDDLIVGLDPAAYVVFGRSRDPDVDGLIFSEDNCLLQANADQRDTNRDGIGNRCDADLDNDCIVDLADLATIRALLWSNSLHADLDGDGVVSLRDLAMARNRLFRPAGPSGTTNACTTSCSESGAGSGE